MEEYQSIRQVGIPNASGLMISDLVYMQNGRFRINTREAALGDPRTDFCYAFKTIL